jgi:mono/diheme cytochrome c family protein
VGRLTLCAVLLFFSLAAAPSSQEAGRAIYEDGAIRTQISATRDGQPLARGRAACAACHGASGLGASEGGVAAPAIAYFPGDQVELTRWLASALRDGRGKDGRALSSAMPRYDLTDKELADLAAYVKSLPYPPEEGLDGNRIAIGLDLEGTAFSEAERGVLQGRVASALSRINENGGMFGRQLVLTAPDRAFHTISWRGRSDRPSLSVLAPAPGSADCPSCCGSLHAELETQIEWLAQWLDERGQAAAYRGALAEKVLHPVSARGAKATVFIDRPGEVTGAPAGPLYLFSELGAVPAALQDRPETYLVLSFELDRRVRDVAALTRSSPDLASGRMANAAFEIDQAVVLLTGALQAIGRRVTSQDLCAGVRKLAAQNYSFSVFDVGAGQSLKRTEPGSSR